MATTYGELLQAITNDLVRPDLTDAAQDFSQKIIFSLQRVFWYNSPAVEIVTLTQGDPFVTVPDNLVDVEVARLNYQSVWQVLREVDYNDILRWDTNIPPTQSVPTDYAPWAESLRFFPVPDKAYQVELNGPGKIPAPENEDDSNFWTVDCFTLVRHLTTAQIRLIRLRDPAGAEQDFIAAEREKVSILGETALRESDNMVTGHW